MFYWKMQMCLRNKNISQESDLNLAVSLLPEQYARIQIKPNAYFVQFMTSLRNSRESKGI